MADDLHTLGANGRPVSAFNAALTMRLIDEEWSVLYTLASVALDRLRPAEGVDPEEHPAFIEWQLVKLLHERLESTEHRDMLRERLLGVAAPERANGGAS